jgi:hypothetical protein
VSFEAVELSEYIDVMLADTHELIEELKSLFGFVFIDTDRL